MSFLILDEKTNKVSVVPEARDFAPIKVLRGGQSDLFGENADAFFNDALVYIYHVYRKDHCFRNLPINERKVRTTELYLNGKDYRKFDGNKGVQDVVKLYIELEYTQNEWAYQRLKVDISETVNSINEIPMVKEHYVEHTEDVDIVCPHCKKEINTPFTVKFQTKIDNSEERVDALKNLLFVTKAAKEFEQIVEKDNRTKEFKNSEGHSLLESNFFERKSQ